MKTLYPLLMFFVTIFTNAQVTPTLHNNLGTDWVTAAFLDKTSNQLYLCYSDQGVIKKVNLNIPNAPAVMVITSLTNPTDITVINNKLYVLEGATGLIDDMPIPNTGTLSYYDLSLTNPPKNVLYNNLNVPLKMAAGNGFLITDENTISKEDPDDFDQQIISKWSITGAPQKTTLLTRSWYSDSPSSEAFEHFEVIGDMMYANSYQFMNGYFYQFNLQNSLLETTHTFTENTPYTFSIYNNYFYFTDGGSSSDTYKTPLSSNNVTTITDNFFYNKQGISFYDWEFDAQGNAFVLGEAYTDDISTIMVFKYTQEQLLSTQKISEQTKVTIFPNPTKSVLNFSQELSEVKIVDLSGRQVLSDQSKAKNISVENLPKGNYLITAKDKNGKVFTEKFAKE